jgi:two-component system nitrate/nitrite response regulator NarL
VAPSPGRAETRIVIVEDHQLFAEAVDLALSVEGYDVRRVDVPTATGSAGILVANVIKQRPRVVLLDLDLGRFGDGMNLIAPLARAHINVVVLTASEDIGRWGGCMRLGARKIVPKSGALQQALSTVRRLHQGLPVTSSDELEMLLSAWAEQRREHDELRRRLDMLTPRERQILGALIEGRTVRAISEQSVVSEATVRTQVKSILSKLEVSSQLAAVGMANHVGWKQGA